MVPLELTVIRWVANYCFPRCIRKRKPSRISYYMRFHFHISVETAVSECGFSAANMQRVWDKKVFQQFLNCLWPQHLLNTVHMACSS